MSAPHPRAWTQEEFFAWEGNGDARYEFDGEQPVAMGSGTFIHSVIMRNLHRAVDRCLDGSACQVVGPDAAVETLNQAIRYPDALITCASVANSARIVPGVVAVFEIVSPSSSRIDRVVKSKEYACVPTIRCYVLIETATRGVTVMSRSGPDQPWTLSILAAPDAILRIAEPAIEIPVRALYERTQLPDDGIAGD